MTTKRRRAKLLTLLLPVFLLLGACTNDNTVKVSESGDLTYTSLIDVSNLGHDNEQFCKMLRPVFSNDPQMAQLGTINVQAVDDGGSTKCQINLEFSSTLKSQVYSQSGDTGRVSIPASLWQFFDQQFQQGLNGSDLGNINFSMTIEGPGDIKDASDGGQIQGNKVTWSDYNSIKANGTEASFSMSGSSSPSSSSSSPSTSRSSDGASSGDASSDDANSASSDNDSGFPMWAWFAIGLAALALIGAIVFFAVRRKNKNDNGPGGLGGPSAPVPGLPAYGQPPQYGQGGQPGALPGAGGPQYNQSAPQYGQGGQSAPQYGQPQPPQYGRPPQYGQAPQPGQAGLGGQAGQSPQPGQAGQSGQTPFTSGQSPQFGQPGQAPQPGQPGQFQPPQAGSPNA